MLSFNFDRTNRPRKKITRVIWSSMKLNREKIGRIIDRGGGGEKKELRNLFILYILDRQGIQGMDGRE